SDPARFALALLPGVLRTATWLYAFGLLAFGFPNLPLATLGLLIVRPLVVRLLVFWLLIVPLLVIRLLVLGPFGVLLAMLGLPGRPCLFWLARRLWSLRRHGRRD